MSWRRWVAGFVAALTAVIVGVASITPYPTPVPISGGCPAAGYRLIDEPAPSDSAISFCGHGNADELSIATTALLHSRYLHLSYTGYPRTAGEKITLRSASGGELQLELPNAGELWRSQIIAVPKRLAGPGYWVVADDNSAGGFGWLGLGNVYQSFVPFDLQRAARIALILLILHVIAVFGLAAAQSTRSLPAAVICSTAFTGLAGYSAFWAFFLKPEIGYAFCGAAWMAFISYVAKTKPSTRNLVRANAFVSLITLYTLLVLWVAFYPFADVLTEAAGERFFTLRTDNILPLLLADQICAGHLLHPMAGDWLASDRPPLQAGLYLLFGVSDHTYYQVLSSWLEASSLLSIAALLQRNSEAAFRCGIYFSLGVSALYIQTSAFVWPKLLAASFTTLLYCLVLENVASELRPRAKATIAGLVASLSLLAHGGALFALPGIGVLALLRKQRPSIKNLAVAATALIIPLVPWFLFQKFVDPPGDRLLKWHLAGLMARDETITFAGALRQAYSNLSFSQWFGAKLHGLWLVFSGFCTFPIDLLQTLVGLWSPSQLRASIQDHSFSGSSYILWFFTIALAVPVAVFVNRRTLPPAVARRLLLASFISFLVWIVVLFNENGALIHQGGYFNNIALIIGVAWIVWDVSPRMFWMAICANALAAFTLYAQPHEEIIREPVSWMGCAVCLALFLISSWGAAVGDETSSVS